MFTFVRVVVGSGARLVGTRPIRKAQRRRLSPGGWTARAVQTTLGASLSEVSSSPYGRKTLVANTFLSIPDEQAALIGQAALFFVATADPALSDGPGGIGPVNLSPKGGVTLHVLGPNRVAYLDYAGSGNETARHSSAGGPITIMVCAFEREDAAVVRLYGRAHVTPLATSPLADRLLQAPASDIALPERQVIEIDVDGTSTSCGYGVPVMSLEKQRTRAERGRRYKPNRKPAR